MNIVICQDAKDLGRRAGEEAAERIRRAIQERGQARIIVATGASQFEVLAALVAAAGHRLAEGHRISSGRVSRPADVASGLLPPLSQGAAGRPRADRAVPLH